MATLIVKCAGKRGGGVVPNRVLIGRSPCNGIIIRDSTVSRLHAWIDAADGSFFLTDCASIEGTFVNGQAVRTRHALTDGDLIQIGPAEIRFKSDSELPPDVTRIDLAGPSSETADGTDIIFNCACGAPSWARREQVGKVLQCRCCQQSLVVPGILGQTAHEAASLKSTSPPRHRREKDSILQALRAAPSDDTVVGSMQTCGICERMIQVSDPQTRCPECSMTFHASCWQDNLGCSTEGCAQVNVLAPDLADSLPPPEAIAMEPAERQTVLTRMLSWRPWRT